MLSLRSQIVSPSRRAEFGRYFNELGLVGQGAEIGVLRGDFSLSLLKSWKGELLHLVDPWRHLPNYNDISNLTDEKFEQCFQITMHVLQPFRERIRVHRCTSAEANKHFDDRSLDFVYIDANHSYKAVVEDLRIWYPKVKVGGVIAGHDFVDGELPEGSFGVAHAVSEFVSAKNIELNVLDREPWPSWHCLKNTPS